jgi:hypothetical protein
MLMIICDTVNKKITLGAIAVVVIIVSTSFTSVMGEQARDSSERKGSPLFTIRLLRATNKPYSEVVTSEYIGQEKTMAILFPAKNTTLSLFHKAVDGISKMDDASFNKFLNAAVNKLCYSNKVKEGELPNIKKTFQFMRENPDEVKKYAVDEKEGKKLSTHHIGCIPPTFDHSSVKCLLYAATIFATILVMLPILFVTFPLWYPILVVFLLSGIMAYFQTISSPFCRS